MISCCLRHKAIDVGTTVRLERQFETLDYPATPMDPDVVTLRLKDPTGNAQQVASERVSAGLYAAEFVVGRAGQWFYRWETEGPIRAHVGSFVVRRNQFDAGGIPDVFVDYETFDQMNWGTFNALTYGDY